jgi:hypothetical protein
LDKFGSVKVKDSYFTSKFDRVFVEGFAGFSIQIGLDDTKITLVERISTSNEKVIVMVFDEFSLKLINELE